MGVYDAFRRIPRSLFRFERILAILLMGLPIPLLVFDRGYRAENCPPGSGMGNCRRSISAYYDMIDPKWFYVPLAFASMLFIINGVVRAQRHGYNAFLGFALLGLVMFNHESTYAAHTTFAATFFVSAIVLMSASFTEYAREAHTTMSVNHQRLIFLVSLAAQFGLFAILWWTTNLFFAEWVELFVIGVQYWIHSKRHEADGESEVEPTTVLKRLWPVAYNIVAAVLTPFGAIWKLLTTPES